MGTSNWNRYRRDASIYNALEKRSDENILFSPNWWRAMWKIQATTLVWYPAAKKNGLRMKDIR